MSSDPVTKSSAINLTSSDIGVTLQKGYTNVMVIISSLLHHIMREGFYGLLKNVKFCPCFSSARGLNENNCCQVERQRGYLL